MNNKKQQTVINKNNKKYFHFFWEIWLSPKKTIKNIFELDWSYYKIFLWICLLGSIMGLLSFFMLLMEPLLLYENVLGPQILYFKPFWREVLWGFINIVVIILNFYVFFFILKTIFRLFGEKVLYKKILLLGVFMSSYNIVLAIYSIVFLIIYEFIPVLITYSTWGMFSLYLIIFGLSCRIIKYIFGCRLWKAILVFIMSIVVWTFIQMCSQFIIDYLILFINGQT